MEGDTCYTPQEDLSPITPKCDEVGDAIQKIKNLLDNGGTVTISIKEFFNAVDYFESGNSNGNQQFGVKFVGKGEINQKLHLSSQTINKLQIEYPSTDKILLRGETNLQNPAVIIDLKQDTYNIEFNNGQSPIDSIPSSGYVELSVNKNDNTLLMKFDQENFINQELQNGFNTLISNIENAKTNNNNHATRIILDLGKITPYYFSGNENLFNEKGQLGQLKIVFSDQKASLQYHLNREVYVLANRDTGIKVDGEVALTKNTPIVIRNHNLESGNKKCYVKEDWIVGGIYNNDPEIEFQETTKNGLAIATNDELIECSALHQEEVDTALLDELARFLSKKEIKAFVGKVTDVFPLGVFSLADGGLKYTTMNKEYIVSPGENEIHIKDGEINTVGSVLVLIRNCSSYDNRVVIDVVEEGEENYKKIHEHFNFNNIDMHNEKCSPTLKEINKRINDEGCINYIENENTYNFTLVNLPVRAGEKVFIYEGKNSFELKSQDRFFTQYSDTLKSEISLGKGKKELAFSKNAKLKFSKYYFDKEKECYEYDKDKIFISETERTITGNCHVPYSDENIDEPRCMDVGEVISKIKNILNNEGREMFKTEQFFKAIESLKYLPSPDNQYDWGLELYIRGKEEIPQRNDIDEVVINDIKDSSYSFALDKSNKEHVFNLLEDTYIIETITNAGRSSIYNIDDEGNVVFEVKTNDENRRVLTIDFRKRNINAFKAFVEDAKTFLKDTVQIIILPYKWIPKGINSFRSILMLNIFNTRVKQELNKGKIINLRFHEILTYLDKPRLTLEKDGKIKLSVGEEEYDLYSENNDKAYLLLISPPQQKAQSNCINIGASKYFCLEGIIELKKDYPSECSLPIVITEENMKFSRTIKMNFCGNTNIPISGLIGWTFKNFYMIKVTHSGKSILFMVASTEDALEYNLKSMLEEYKGDINYLKQAKKRLFKNEE